MNTTRIDIHAPSRIIPSDYEYVAVWTMNIQGFGDAEFILRERAICKAHMGRTGGTYSAHEHGGSCDVCGNALAIYLVLFYHAKSNTYIRVGVNCAQKLDLGLDMKAVSLFKKHCANAREQQAGKRKAIALLSDVGLIDAWEVFTAEPVKHAVSCALLPSNYQFNDGWQLKCTCGVVDTSNEFPEPTITDIVGKLVRYGNISDNQKSFVAKLLKQIVDRPIIEAQRQAEREAAQAVVEGRYEVSGEVVTVKEVETGKCFHYGDDGVRTKVLIRLDGGAKVWGSRFANVERGQHIRFTATFQQSKDDSKFGFFSRPTPWVSPEERILQVFQYHWPEATNA